MFLGVILISIELVIFIGIFTQVIIPILQGKKLFPLFRNKKGNTNV
jgi:hypothetical protein